MLSFPGLVFPCALFLTRDISVLTPLLFWANYSVLKLLLVGRTGLEGLQGLNRICRNSRFLLSFDMMCPII